MWRGSRKPGPAQLDAKVSWLVCRATCIPGKAELIVNAQRIGPSRQIGFAKLPIWHCSPVLLRACQNRRPADSRPSFSRSTEGFRLGVVTGRRETSAEFFPSDQNIIDNPAAQSFASAASGLVLDLKKDASLAANPAQLRGVLELSEGRTFEISALPGKVAAGESTSHCTNDANSSFFLRGLSRRRRIDTVQSSPAPLLSPPSSS